MGDVVEDTDGIRVLIEGSSPLPGPVVQRAGLLGVVWALQPEARMFGPLRSTERVPLPVGVSSFVAFDSVWSAAHPPPPVDRFVNVHTHTEASALDGLTTIPELLDTVVGLGQEAVAVTDHGTCANHPSLLDAAPGAGVRPICGLEAYWVADRRSTDRYNHLILWALDPTGLENLWGLSTEAQRSGFHGTGRCDWDLLERYSEGLAVSTACLRGPVASAVLRDDEAGARAWLGRAARIFPGRLWVELHTNHLPEQVTVNPALVDIARSMSLPLIAAADSHYATASDAETHRLWMLARTGKDTGSDDAELFRSSQSYHLLDSAAVRQALSYLPTSAVDEAIAQTVVLASSCSLGAPAKAAPPLFDPLRGSAYATERLRAVCEANWERKITSRLPHLPIGLRHPEADYLQRYDFEMDLLGSKSFHDYFMIVEDYVRHAKQEGILCGPGRGSGVASLVAYLSDITEIDPVAYGLLFARFLTPGRVKPPDFDIDFPTSAAGEMYRYVASRWGEANVARIGSVLRMRNRAAIKAARRMLVERGQDISFVATENLCKLVEAVEADSAGLGKTWEEVSAELGPLLDEYRQSYPEVIDLASKIVGRISSYGKHASGVVISTDAGAGNLFSRLPMRRGDDSDSGEDPLATQMVTDLDYRVLESWGFLKFDFLFLRTLDTLQRCLDLIRDRRNRKIWPYEWTQQLEDPQVWEAISDGQTLGCFQIETPGGTRLIRRFRPSSITELADVITLVRPGPSRSGITESYLRRRAGAEPVTFLHPHLESILASTQGGMLYQEQVMQICITIGGYDDVQADEIREILGKKLKSRTAEAGRRFIAAAAKRGYPEALAPILWAQMEEFALYSFNRSHAIGYAFLAYYCAWLRVHYPEEFFAAVLSTLTGAAKKRVPEFVSEFQKMGYSVRPPDVNLSEVSFSAEDMAVRYGLGQLKGIGAAAAAPIVARRPYTSVDDFLEKMKGTKVNSGHIRLLASVGALDSLEPNRKALEARLAATHSGDDSRCVHAGSTPNEVGVCCDFDWAAEPVTFTAKGKPKKRRPPPSRCTKSCRQYSPVGFDDSGIVAYTPAEIRDREMSLLGVWLSSTPFDSIPQSLWSELVTGADLPGLVPGRYYLPGVLRRIRLHTDSNGNPMAFLSLTTADDDADVVVFSKAFAECRKNLAVGSLGLYEIDVSYRDAEVSAALHAMRPLVIPEGVSSAEYTPALLAYATPQSSSSF